jgi:catechol 2,3-dioxygenase-like lactoylglutathione lyase family enzyme
LTRLLTKIPAAFVLAALTFASAHAQEAAEPIRSAIARDVPNMVGASMGHWHLNSADIEGNKKIFLAMGGTLLREGNFEVVQFPNVRVTLAQREPKPPTGGTVGSRVNHVGFLVRDMKASYESWKKAGVPVEWGHADRTDQAWVITPDGLKIEVLEDKTQPEPIRHEHIHFYAAPADAVKMQEWYTKMFGAQTVTNREGRGRYIDIPGVQLRIASNPDPVVPIRGRVLDHIGFDVKNLEGFTKKLEAQGVKFDTPYRFNPQTGVALAFLTDPWGTYIELNERFPPKPAQ